MRTLRAFFLGTQLREKVLLVALILLLVAVWGSNFNKRLWLFKRSVQSTTLELGSQQQWLDNQATIEATVKRTADGLVASRTLDDTGLLAAVGSLAAEAGVHVTSSESHDEQGGQFTVHTRTFQIDRTEWEPLKKFYLSLQTRSPYIGYEQLSLQPDKANLALTTGSIRVSAPEVLH